MKSEDKIIYYNLNKIINEFTIKKPIDYKTFIDEIKEKNIHSFEIKVIINKQFFSINENNFLDYHKKFNEFIIIEKKSNISQSQFIYDQLNDLNQNLLDEKCICCICNDNLIEKPYYCYNCHKLYCNICFQKLEISTLKKCENCKENCRYNKEFCNNCKVENNVEFAKCRFCYFQLNKKDWRKLISYDREKEYAESMRLLDYEKLLSIFEYKYNKINSLLFFNEKEQEKKSQNSEQKDKQIALLQQKNYIQLNNNNNNFNNNIIFNNNNNNNNKKEKIYNENNINNFIFKPEDEFSKYIFEKINEIRQNPKKFVEVIEENKKKITTSKKGRLIYKSKVKVALKKGEESFNEAINQLNETQPMEKLIFEPLLTIPLPTNESEINDKDYLKIKVKEIVKNVHVKSYWRDIVKDPETSFILMVVDDSEKNSGQKRKSILDPNIKYIGINSTSFGKSFACYILLSDYL